MATNQSNNVVIASFLGVASSGPFDKMNSVVSCSCCFGYQIDSLENYFFHSSDFCEDKLSYIIKKTKT